MADIDTAAEDIPPDPASTPAEPQTPTGEVVSEDDLRAALATQRARADAAEVREAEERRRADEAHSQAGTATAERYRSEEDRIAALLRADGALVDQLEARIAGLHEAADYAGASKLIREMTGAQARIQSLEAYKGQLTRSKEQETAQREAPQRQAQADPLASYSPAARSWISNHPAFLSDAAYNAKVISAHYDAVAHGIAVDSAQYFDHLDQSIGPQREAPQAIRQASVTAMPVTRRTPSAPAPGDVSLSPEQREMADSLFADKPPKERYRYYAEMLAKKRATA